MNIHVIFTIRPLKGLLFHLTLFNSCFQSCGLHQLHTVPCVSLSSAQWLYLMAVDLECGQQGHTNKWYFCAFETVRRGGQLTDLTLTLIQWTPGQTRLPSCVSATRKPSSKHLLSHFKYPSHASAVTTV